MTLRMQIRRVFQQEDLNFLLTNRIPRNLVTRFMGWFSKIENPLVRDVSIALWRCFSELDLREAKRKSFRSLHDCFIRELKDGARPIDCDPTVVVSPCDAIVGSSGRIEDTRVFQIKGFPYTLEDLFCDDEAVRTHRNGCYVTLRLKASMYHRFHAPYDCEVEHVNYISGDTWNVNPIALKRIEKLFCKNERAVLRTRLPGTNHILTLVPVAAILVASIRLHFVNLLLNGDYAGPHVVPCNVAMKKGEEMGWFQHGSTIVVFAPEGFTLCDNAREGTFIRIGEPLMRLPSPRQ